MLRESAQDTSQDTPASQFGSCPETWKKLTWNRRISSEAEIQTDTRRYVIECIPLYRFSRKVHNEVVEWSESDQTRCETQPRSAPTSKSLPNEIQ